MKTITLWQRLRCDVKESISWEAKKYPVQYSGLINDLTKHEWVTDLPFGSAIDVKMIANLSNNYEVFDLFKTNL